MLAWRLWWALNSPLVRHPVFRRTVRSYELEPKLVRHLSSGLSAFLWLMLCPLACTMPLIALCLFLALPGARLAARVAGSIAKDQARGVNEFLGVTPAGGMGIAWIVCTAYRDGRPPDFFLTRDELVGLLFFCCMATLAFGIAGFALFVIGAVVLIFAYFDFAQSLVLGSLVGIWAACNGTRMEARIQAVTGYAALQIIVYVATVLLGWFLMGFTLGKTTPDAVLKLTMMIVALACTLFALRESMIAALWYSLSRILNADLKDVASATYDTEIR